jgi:hypothetical protein
MDTMQGRDTMETMEQTGIGHGADAPFGTNGRAGPPAAPPSRRRRPGLVGPALLVGAGVVLLLNNLGVLPWDIWASVLYLWPILLIAAGLDLLIGRRSPAGSLAVLAITLLALAGGAWLLGARSTPGGRETIDQALAGATRAEVTIKAGVALLRIDATEDQGRLIGGTVDRQRGETLERSAHNDGGTAYFTLGSKAARFVPRFGRQGEEGYVWDLRLNRTIPLRLAVDSGVGQSVLNLGELQVTDLRVNTGVGEATIVLPARNVYLAKVDAGVGAVTIKVPRGLAVRVKADAGLGDVVVPAGYQRQGDWYVSPGYDTAPNRAELDVDGGIGRITVEEVGGR